MVLSCMRNAFGRNYRNSSVIVVLATEQISHSTERSLFLVNVDKTEVVLFLKVIIKFLLICFKVRKCIIFRQI